MIQEQLRHQPQVLAEHRTLCSVHLEDRYHPILIPVDFIPWWIEQWALLIMSDQLRLAGIEVQAVLTDI